ncbi:MAG: type II toxin-antitoxin system VapC family toxin [Terriglobales bacterium]
MIAVDTNILVYAHRTDSPFHAAAADAVRALVAHPAGWAIPWPCVHEFIAVVTNRQTYRFANSVETAVRQVDTWMESPSLRLLSEAPGHWGRLGELVAAGHLSGPKVHDARIAAICLEHGVEELWTADRDFSRMPALRVRNPLIAR